MNTEINRQIKFRAWDDGNKVMHSDFQYINSYSEGDNKGSDWIVFKSDKQKLGDKPHPFENPYFMEQLKIMQYIGLQDLNNKDIYEGDIVEYRDMYGHTKKRIIKWNNEFAKFDAYYDCNYTKIDRFFVVAGNIYESPELLKDK